jgi:hypothetical protein
MLDIDAKALHNIGITHIVFDLDNTLVHRGVNSLADDYSARIEDLKQQGFTVLIGTNSKREISSIKQLLDVAVIQPTRLSYKPRRSFYRRVISAAGTSPKHIAMVGDHFINDVMGGNRAGLTTVLVDTPHLPPSPIKRRYIRRLLQHVEQP